MKYPRFLFLNVLIASCFWLYAQEKNEELIKWTSGKRLTWNDYKAPPDPNSDAAATTTTYLGIKYDIERNQMTFKIDCSFSKNRSWGLYKTEYILSHEQGHFDITEIFARQLNQRMKRYVFNKDTYQDDLKKIYKDILKEKEEFQSQYDDETNYSRIKEKQGEWLTKISATLKSLEFYADY
jgi:hypothetical protein